MEKGSYGRRLYKSSFKESYEEGEQHYGQKAEGKACISWWGWYIQPKLSKVVIERYKETEMRLQKGKDPSFELMFV